ncbi:MAG TPA: hypothetical protein VJS44_02720 [Pyrinomonadaceae bacterium]|nr:hypothetical protein [Pyrinomonadaceae bacterium]
MNGAGVLNIERGGVKEEGRWVRFWRRQFQPEATRGQTVFDVVFGIVLPILCFIFDPAIFRGNFFGGHALFERIQLPVYAMALIEISALTVWLCAGKRLAHRSAALGGMLYAGALISLLIGIALLPLSLIGILLLGLGLLGFTPFFTALVFFRNGRRAFHLGSETVGGERKLAAMALGLLFVLGLPAAVHVKVSGIAEESIEKILKGDETEAQAAAEQLRFISYFAGTETDKIVWAYHNEQNQVRRDRLARLYFRITGKDIEQRLTFLLD